MTAVWKGNRIVSDRILIFRGGWITCTKQYVGKLPIRRIKTSDSDATKIQTSISRAVRHVTAAKEGLRKAKTDRQKTSLQRLIAASESRIDQLVYKLYDLTEDEVELIENSRAEPFRSPTTVVDEREQSDVSE